MQRLREAIHVVHDVYDGGRSRDGNERLLLGGRSVKIAVVATRCGHGDLILDERRVSSRRRLSSSDS